ncbi:MAG: hypothetical protein ACRD4B_02095, partial [Acidobacteriota bacterium]
MRLAGVSPAAGASLFSAVWGAAAAGLLTALILSFQVPPIAAVLSSLFFVMSTSMWVDASIAELHTMTMALTFAALLMAVRFRRSGRPADLYWLVFVSSQGLTHQRAFAFLAPALALLVFRHWRIILHKWLPLLGLALLGPLTYLYLPLVDWLGSQWVFSAPGTWQGFWALLLDTKADRIVSIPSTLTNWGTRLEAVVDLLNGDWPWPLWIAGLLGLTFTWRQPNTVERTALTLTWLVYLILSLVIWEGFISDALLAVKLPVIAMAAIGLAFIAADLARRSQLAGRLAVVGGLAIGVSLFVIHRPQIIQITRDDSAAQTIAMAARIPTASDGRPITLMALWGNDFW